jgi:hypothetical protein
MSLTTGRGPLSPKRAGRFTAPVPDGVAYIEPFETVCGRKIPTQITISTLTAVKNSDWTTVAEVTPATDDPGMLVRKRPIIAAVPA